MCPQCGQGHVGIVAGSFVFRFDGEPLCCIVLPYQGAKKKRTLTLSGFIDSNDSEILQLFAHAGL